MLADSTAPNTTSAKQHAIFITLGVWLLVLLVAWLAYRPGLSGQFLFDDYPNFQGLEHIAARPSMDTFSQYVFNGSSGRLGRPISLATFAAQYRSWPDEPEAFLGANVLIHLFNATLLLGFLLEALRDKIQSNRDRHCIAMGAAALWLIAPIHSGAVLYAVQRMSLLSGTFVFLGLWAYCYGRRTLISGQTVKGLLWASSGIGVGSLLATLAKENGALLPLFALSLETFLLKPYAQSLWSRWKLIFVTVPSLTLIGYLLVNIPNFIAGFSGREFTFIEKIATEPVVLIGYVAKIVVPPLYSLRIYYDDITTFESFWPIGPSFVATSFWVAAATAAWTLRKKSTIPVFAISWFLIAHLLESSFIPLEIAFDHRNYVAAAGITFAISYGFVFLVRHDATKSYTSPLLLLAAIYGLYLLACLWQTADLRGKPLEQAAYWNQQQPQSLRASAEFVLEASRKGRIQAAQEELQRASGVWPDSPSFWTFWFQMPCHRPELIGPNPERVASILRTSEARMLQPTANLTRLVQAIRDGVCRKNFDTAELNMLLAAALESERIGPFEANILLAQAWTHRHAGNIQDYRILHWQAANMKPVFPIIQEGVYNALEDGDLIRAQEYVCLGKNRIPRSQQLTYERQINGLQELLGLVEEIDSGITTNKDPCKK